MRTRHPGIRPRGSGTVNHLQLSLTARKHSTKAYTMQTPTNLNKKADLELRHVIMNKAI